MSKILSAPLPAFTASVADATLQVQAATAAVNLDSSYDQANLFYEQSYHDYNASFDAAEEVQIGPYYCFGKTISYCANDPDPSLPNSDECCNYEQLVHLCNREIKWDAAIKIISTTVSLAAACIDPFTAETKVEGIGKAFGAIGEIANAGLEYEDAFTSVVGK